MLGPDHRWKLRRQMERGIFEFISPLLLEQPWIDRVSFQMSIPINALCLNDFRKTWFGQRRSANLFEVYSEHFRTGPLPQDVAWIECNPLIIPGKPIVISRSKRYRNPHFPWHQVASKYSKRLIFIGLPDEYYEWFLHFGETAVYRPVNNGLEMAQIIAGSKLFIGNQSFPMSLALALGVRLIQEVGHPNADCRFRRTNALYYENGDLMLPDIP